MLLEEVEENFILPSSKNITREDVEETISAIYLFPDIEVVPENTSHFQHQNFLSGSPGIVVEDRNKEDVPEERVSGEQMCLIFRSN